MNQRDLLGAIWGSTAVIERIVPIDMIEFPKKFADQA